MNIDTLNLSKKIEAKFQQFKQEKNYKNIAKLITYSLQVVSRQNNVEIFGYVPGIFRIVEIFLDRESIQSKHIFIGEPVIYKIYYGNNRQLYNLDYLYIFCYFKEKSELLNVYFQSANPNYKKLSQENYDLKQNKVNFEGSLSSFNGDNISVISVSDPGQFIRDLTSSYYVGSPELNFPRLIADILDKLISLSNISSSKTLLFGSSAGTIGALLTSTYLPQKTNVLAVNSQINVGHRQHIMQSCWAIDNTREIMRQYGERVSCFCRFNQKLSVVPNIYILANINDNLYQRNFDFYKKYIENFTQKGIENQSVFDSYYGVDGHGRPEPSSLKAKIKLARIILTMRSRQ